MHYLLFEKGITFFGQVPYGNLLVPGQVSTFAIPILLLIANDMHIVVRESKPCINYFHFFSGETKKLNNFC